MTKPEALDLIARVCRDYRRALPGQIQLYQSTTRRGSSGHYSPFHGYTWKRGTPRKRINKLHVTLGYEGHDHAEVILHECAHHLIGRTAKGRRAGHPTRFWRLHYELCQRYGVTPDIPRNVRYRLKAQVGEPVYEPNTKALAELLVLR